MFRKYLQKLEVMKVFRMKGEITGGSLFTKESMMSSNVFVVMFLKADLSREVFKKYVNDIVPRSIKNQYILNYLIEKGLIMENEKGVFKCSQFGKLIIKLYLYPVSGVLIRNKLEKQEIENYRDLIESAFDVLKAEHRARDNKILDPILEWVDEVPIDRILERYKVMSGDLHSTRDNLERIITFIGIIASHLSNNGEDFRESFVKIAEMCETLRIRLKYGVKEDLFDLVQMLNNVGRVRARILYDVGYHTATKVLKERPYVLSKKTGLGINLCKNIIKMD